MMLFAILMLSLPDEMRTVRDQLRTTGERTARTLVRHGSLRTTLVGLGVGGTLKPDKADGPITVQVLEGTIEFEADGQRWTLPTGSLLALEGGVTHSVSAPQGGVFLLASIRLGGIMNAELHPMMNRSPCGRNWRWPAPVGHLLPVGVWQGATQCWRFEPPPSRSQRCNAGGI